MKNNTLRFSFVLAAVTAMFLLLFQVSFHFDNKYIYPCQAAKMGVLVLDRDKYDKSPLLFLTDGWEYYADKLHTPQSIQYDTPDRYLYIGQFAGFDMGNPKKNPYGSGTYRMNIFAGGRERTYALEIPQIYTDWKLYVNGKLESVGGDESLKYSHISPDNSMITFKAVDKIEIIVSVSAKSGLYSGLTYPPAFGSAKEVAALVNERLLIHTVEATAAILIGVLFLCIGFGCHYRRPYHVLFCISLCYAVTVSYPFVQVFRLNGTIFSLAERFCSYGIFLAFVLLQADILKLPKKSYTWLAALGCTVLLSVCIEPFIEIKEASIKYWYGYYIAFYKLSSAAWLTATSFIAAKHKKESSKPLLVCACIFAASLIMDRVHPLFEPIRFGWPVETAGFAVICIAAGILWWDTLDLYKEKLVLQVEKNGLLETNKLKSDFLSGISHELQMPLAVISGYAQLTARLIDLGKADDNECLDNQHQIVLESQRMERMIRQLLDISRIESGDSLR
ncbi:hypothetical protein MUJ63_04640 [Lachnospiraceae bacterium NSJ-143]|nr:hypothetical protein [Lachnospiraceae bacterium NSJ-143]